ncbi:VWA domain-containing protein [Desulfovibrio ferrophilus]|uniref:von Willebrand factor type A n=1 Tax=Desulfovibrio ferrophilus TaxID=241368 RepID=A0A2Z6B169_9BACT|nr:VWA domain-containing protein [Desulfovibrio ferrophilus]BBD09170.1 von Willebrand factor type A [Desulfovibrio ferrophilus]
MRRFAITAFALLSILIMQTPTTALAATKTNLVLIFDASGSMWGQINGKAKITIAKEALDGIVKDLPDDIDIGLVTYGHRRKGDCDDVETLVPLGPIDKQAFLTKIKDINPKGKTPIVRSIRMTAEAIKHLEDETTLLLVSDGEETCDPDPCAFVAELKKLGINFVMHVVGFDVGGETEAQLKCMAEAGGGEYFPASDADKLKGALDTVVKKTVAKNLVVNCFDDKKTPVSVMISVLDPSGKLVASDGGRRVSFGLAPGTYTLKINPDTLSENKVIKNVTVTADQVTRKDIVFGKSQVIVTMKDGDGSDVPGYIRIVDQKTEQYVKEGDHKGASSGFIVSPGEYVVDMECSNTGRRIKSEAFTLRSGENRNINGICANARIGVLVVDENGKAVTGYIRIVDIPTDSYADEADSRSSMRFFEVPPGRYKVDVECPNESRLRSLPFGIGQGQENQVTVNCRTKVIKTTLPKPDDVISTPPQSNNSAVQPPVQASQSATAAPPKQTVRETKPPSQSTALPPTQSPQDMQAMADQMQALAQTQAAAAQADAMAQMQATMAQMQGNQLPQLPQTPTQQAAASGADARLTDKDMNENPKDIALPQAADGPAGYSAQRPTAEDHGAQATGTVGAPPSHVDYSNVGAQDTGGGLSDQDEHPEQGHNPYAGMSKEEMQAAFARDMGMQGPQGTGNHNRDNWQLGKAYPLQCKRHENTLGNRLDTCTQQAQNQGRSDILGRIQTARTNLAALAKQREQRVPKDVLQQTLNRCVQEVHAIQISLAQGQ